MNNILLAIAALIVVVLTALIAIPPLIDWNDYRGVFEEEVSRVFGRDVRVRGDVSLRILPQPFLSFEEVQIAEEPGVTGEPFLRADGFMIRLAVPPLLRGIIEAKNVVVQRPRVRLRIDENGRGSWQELNFTQSSLGFVPNDVALRAVDIVDGEVTVEGPSRDILWRLSNVSGELTSAALKGPFKFIGRLKWRGESNDLRVSTGTFEDNGEPVPAKVVVRSSDGFSSLTVDGLVTQRAEQVPELTGEVTAQTTLTSLDDRPGGSQTGPLPGNRIEARAKLRLDAQRFALDEIVVSFDQSGRPQLLTGGASADFSTSPTLNLDLSSRWLDLDRLSGERADASPLLLARALAKRVTDLQPDLFARTEVQLRIDQATLAGSAVGNVAVEASTADGELELRQLSALLPGSAQLNLDGKFRPATQAPATEAAGPSRQMQFDGHLLISGNNAARFASWLGRNADEAQVVRAVDFFLRSEVESQPTYAALKNAIIRVGTARYSGDLGYRWDEVRRLTLALTGDEVDLSSLFPDALDEDRIAGIFRGLGITSAAPELGELDLKIDAGVMRDASRSLRDVKVDLVRTREAVTIQRLQARSDDGLAVSASGTISAATEGGVPEIRLDGDFRVASALGRNRLARMLAGLSTVAASTLAEKLPNRSRLAYKLVQDPAAEMILSLDLDGTIGDSRVRAEFTSAGRWSELVDKPVAVSLNANAPSSQMLLVSLSLLDERSATAPQAGGDPAQLTAVARGSLKTGLLTTADLESAGETVRFRGEMSLNKRNSLALTGQVAAESPDVRRLAGLADPVLADRLPEVPVNAFAEVAGALDELTFTIPQVRVGQVGLRGTVRLSPPFEKDGTRLSGDLRVTELRVADLVQSFVDTDIPIETPLPERPTDQIADIWPSARFQPELLTRYNLDLTLAIARLELAEGLALSDATLGLTAGNRGVSIRSLTAEGPRGGTVAAELDLTTDGVGVSIAGRVSGQDIPFASPTDENSGAGASADRGTASLALDFKGRGLSPRALVTVLSGEGEVKLGNGQLEGLAPDIVPSIAATFIVNSDLEMDDLPDAIRSARSGRPLMVEASEHSITIKDGALQISNISQNVSRGRVENRTTVDLARLKFDSSWRLIPELPRRDLDWNLPPIELVFSGDIADIADAELTVRADALAREIVVRRLEGNVQELERLRRLDEERARAEAERRRLRGAAPDPDRVEGTESDASAPASPGFDRPIIRPAVPELIAPPVLQVPLPLPEEEPRQRSQRGQDGGWTAWAEASPPRVGAPDDSIMRLGTPVSPYDPVSGTIVPQSGTGGENATPYGSGIVDIRQERFTALEVPVPRLLGPRDAASVLGSDQSRRGAGSVRIPASRSGDATSEGERRKSTRSGRQARPEARRAQSTARRRSGRARDWRLQALFPRQ